MNALFSRGEVASEPLLASTHRQICLCIAAALLTLTGQPSSLQQLVQSLSQRMTESAGTIYLTI
jgi:hypothetical protein